MSKKDDLERYELMSKVAGKAGGLFGFLILLGCLIPVAVICVGTLFTK